MPTFTLEFQGQTTWPLALDATADDVQLALTALASIGHEGVRVSGEEDEWTGLMSWMVTFGECLQCGGDVPLLAFEASGPVESVWVITEVTEVRKGGLIRSIDSSSEPTNSSTLMSGSWGNHSAPTILLCEALDSGSQPGIGVHDSITIWFDKETNRVAMDSKSQVDLYFDFSSTWATDYYGVWEDSRTLSIVIASITDPVDIPPGILGGATAPYSLSRIGLLTMTSKVVHDGNLAIRSADLSSPPLEEEVHTLVGSWGQHSPPAIVQCRATEAGPLGVGLDQGDIVTITFDQHTSLPVVASKMDIDRLLRFSAPIGSDYTGFWSTFRDLVITVTNALGAGSELDIAPGHLVVYVSENGGLKSADLSSANSTSSSLVVGTWGGHPSEPQNLTFGLPTHSRVPLFFEPPLSDGGSPVIYYKLAYKVNSSSYLLR
jgi:hypothetical protein